MKNTKILIIGLGNIGFRHLQAISKLQHGFDLILVDTDPKQLSRCKKELGNVKSNFIRNVFYEDSLDSISSNVEVAIICTSSINRRKILEELLSHVSVKFLILEKVLFQSVEDYSVVSSLLLKNGVRTWVNCPRRSWDFYINLKEKVKFSSIKHFEFSGSSIGIACNSIHLIDLMSFLTNKTDYDLNISNLDNKIIESKRDNFIEFTGELNGSFKEGPSFAIKSFEDANFPFVTKILMDSASYLILEDQGIMFVNTTKGDYVNTIQEKIEVPFQSNLTNVIVEQLLSSGKCNLVSFKESSALHIPMLTSFLEHYNLVGRNKEILCPIT